jgi:phage gp45-like
MSDGLFQRLSRRVENMIFRAVVRYAKSTSQGGAISAQLAGRSGDTLDGVVVFEGYGFSHIPLPVDANVSMMIRDSG